VGIPSRRKRTHVLRATTTAKFSLVSTIAGGVGRNTGIGCTPGTSKHVTHAVVWVGRRRATRTSCRILMLRQDSWADGLPSACAERPWCGSQARKHRGRAGGLQATRCRTPPLRSHSW
jgi:hypothetical protein